MRRACKPSRSALESGRRLCAAFPPRTCHSCFPQAFPQGLRSATSISDLWKCERTGGALGGEQHVGADDATYGASPPAAGSLTRIAHLSDIHMLDETRSDRVRARSYDLSTHFVSIGRPLDPVERRKKLQNGLARRKAGRGTSLRHLGRSHRDGDQGAVRRARRDAPRERGRALAHHARPRKPRRLRLARRRGARRIDGVLASVGADERAQRRGGRRHRRASASSPWTSPAISR